MARQPDGGYSPLPIMALIPMALMVGITLEDCTDPPEASPNGGYSPLAIMAPMAGTAPLAIPGCWETAPTHQRPVLVSIDASADTGLWRVGTVPQRPGLAKGAALSHSWLLEDCT
ncbi:hypothetical protein PCASD_21583 [Puccinia coronata f. sp. avenae]|uniref:Uncharacterized protein n=1 Tax=Puccinia coronata f. sp. avenae TaxID=200324 RepID=A0A2N5UH58_9BASI|nr:hypothetical protein PCASD_21583 [Puccinia coronata f. sp. avenae]